MIWNHDEEWVSKSYSINHSLKENYRTAKTSNVLMLLEDLPVEKSKWRTRQGLDACSTYHLLTEFDKLNGLA